MINKLKEILISTIGNKNIEINENTVILRDLGLNSLETIELICAVEEEFDIEIANKKIRSIVTIGDLLKIIESQQ